MNILDVIINRRSIRKYTGQEIPREVLMQLIKAGMYAPSAVNKQPWHFILVTDKKLLNKIADVHPHGSMLRQAAAAIVVLGDVTLAHTPDYMPVDCAAATENILLAAHGLGLGAVWVGIHPREERKNALRELFRLPDQIQPFSVISLGYPAENIPVPDRFRPDRIHENGW